MRLFWLQGLAQGLESLPFIRMLIKPDRFLDTRQRILEIGVEIRDTLADLRVILCTRFVKPGAQTIRDRNRHRDSSANFQFKMNIIIVIRPGSETRSTTLRARRRRSLDMLGILWSLGS